MAGSAWRLGRQSLLNARMSSRWGDGRNAVHPLRHEAFHVGGSGIVTKRMASSGGASN